MTVAAALDGSPGPAAKPLRRFPLNPAMHLVPSGGGVATTLLTAERGLLPDPRALTARLAQAIAEVLAGARAAGQLAGVTSVDVLALLQRRSSRLGTRLGASQPRPIVGSVHISEPCEGVVEACAVINTGSRVRALALRLEASNGQWRCTALAVG
jgi:hypothetical protein